MSILTDISEALQKGRAKQIKTLVPQALEEGIPAKEILEEGLLSGMNVIGEKFKNNEVFVPEVLVAARAMNVGAELLKPALAESGVSAKGKVCIGTVKGDLHDIGKNLVRMMFEGKGLEVIACSALLTTTMPAMADVVKAAEASGIRDKVKIMVGGAPVTDQFCREIGADAYTADATSAAEKAVELLTA